MSILYAYKTFIISILRRNDNRNINELDVRKAYKTPRQALADIKSGERENTISLAPRNHRKSARKVRKIRPPPPPFVEVGNQTYKVGNFLKTFIISSDGTRVYCYLIHFAYH